MHFHARFIYQKCISSDVLDELFLENVKDVVVDVLFQFPKPHFVS